MNSGSHEVVVTGVGPVTAIGVGRTALWSALREGRTHLVRRKLAVGVREFAEMTVASMPPAAEVPGLEPHLAALAKQDCNGYRDLAYTVLAAELAFADAGLRYDRNDNRIGAIQAFESPGVEQTVGRLLELMSMPPSGNGPPPVYDLLAPSFYHTQSFIYVHLLGQALGLHGFSTSVHNACASGAFAIEVAAQRIRSGQADAMIVVGGEAFETAVRLEWFRRLDLYVRNGHMRPFDDEPGGFYVGEGAGALVLESATHAAQRGATPYATYAGAAFAHQAGREVVPDLEAHRLSVVIGRALEQAHLGPRDVDLIVPHGAATAVSDGYEAACLARAFEGSGTRAVATAFKPYVGHTLAASGIVETIAALLAMHHQTVPATLHSRAERVKLPVPLVTALTERPIRSVLKLSTGFTGHDAALVFRRA